MQHTIAARAWREAGLQPHRLERYMRSTDPDFETKAADVIGLYLDPPQRAVDVIARGVFTSVTDLRRKLTRYIKQ